MAHPMRDAIGGGLIMGFLGAGAALYVAPVPADNHDLIVFMLGQLSGFVGGVVAFHYGTSAGSQRKTDLLAQAGKDPANVP